MLAPVVARFEQMPTKFAALVWDRVMYMDCWTRPRSTTSTPLLGASPTAGQLVAPPEQQCNPPSPSPGESPAASDGASASPAASDAASPSAPAASPSRRAEPVRELRPAPCSCTPTTTDRRARFGVLVDGQLLTGGQLEKRGGLDRYVLTHLGIATLAHAGRLAAARRGGNEGRSRPVLRSIDPRRRRPRRRSRTSARARSSASGSTTPTTSRKAAARRRTGRCCSPSSPTRSSATARPSSGRAAPTPWISRWSWGS